MSLFLLVVSAAAAASAQLPDNSSMLPVKQVRLLVADYGDCIVKREPRRAAEAILAGNDVDLMDRYPHLVQDTCVPVRGYERVEVRFEGNQYRYAIAEALVRRELAAVAPPVLDDVPPLDHGREVQPPTADAKGRPLTGAKAEAAERDYQRWQASRYMWRFGECVVRVDPAGAKQLLMTRVESAEERAQFGAMATSLGTCVAEGQKLELGKAALRGTIAVAYYRLAKARTGLPAGGAL